MRFMASSRFAVAFRVASLHVLLTAGLSAETSAQTFDFEASLDGWTATGTAFDRQPIGADAFRTDDFVEIALGGDYWRGLRYPIGQHGQWLVSTVRASDDSRIGTLTSPTFTIAAGRPVFSFLIGGSDDIASERLELQVLAPEQGRPEFAAAIERWAAESTPRPLPEGAPRTDGEYYVLAAATGGGSPRLRQVWFRLPPFVEGRTARIRIIDTSPSADISVDFVRFTAERPETFHPPVWGYADYHTHPASQLGFGGLKDIHTLWGRPSTPGRSFDDYEHDPSLVAEDLPHCTPGHDGGPIADVFVDVAQNPLRAGFFDLVRAAFTDHARDGGPEFGHFPGFDQGAHHQMHLTQIRRNFDGGLRLMVALATDNVGAQYLMSSVKDGHVELRWDLESVEAQIDLIRGLVSDNESWMAIALSADDARRAIDNGKLAVILGVEVDSVGSLGFSSAREEVSHLWDLGVRAVIPIHGLDNAIGGAAVFQPAYNSVNDLVHRGAFDLRHEELSRFPRRFFEIEREKACGLTDRSPASKGECVQFRLEAMQKRVEIAKPVVPPSAWGRLSPWFTFVRVPSYDTDAGHRNVRGLTAYGDEYLDALMDRGMIIDTAHMSARSVADAFRSVGRRLGRVRPDCREFSFLSDMSASCYADAYPLIVSHAGFRGQAAYGEKEFSPSEYDIGDRHVEMIRRVGGVVGPFLVQVRIQDHEIVGARGTIANNCAMSSRSFAYALHYAVQKMGGAGVGTATDFTFIPQVLPRFGPDGCSGFNFRSDGKRDLKRHPERYLKDSQYDAVVYAAPRAGARTHASVPPGRLGSNLALTPYVMGQRAYDFNVDGLAHFGLVPDLLQDIKNMGVGAEDLEPVFGSAEAYLRMWEKAERLSRPPTSP